MHFVVVVGILAASSTGRSDRTRFEISDKLPLFQVIADLDSEVGLGTEPVAKRFY